MTTSYIALGTNLGNREEQLEQAILGIAENQEIQIIRGSSIYETDPWGETDQPSFYNAVIEIETKLSAISLLEFLQDIEDRLGRIRSVHWGPRTIDLDILFYGKEIIQSKDLVIPHPYMLERGFVMIPLMEIAPNFIHPKFGKTIKDLAPGVSSEGIHKKGKLNYFNQKG